MGQACENACFPLPLTPPQAAGKTVSGSGSSPSHLFFPSATAMTTDPARSSSSTPTPVVSAVVRQALRQAERVVRDLTRGAGSGVKAAGAVGVSPYTRRRRKHTSGVLFRRDRDEGLGGVGSEEEDDDCDYGDDGDRKSVV